MSVPYYLWIALGGALGSVARAWVALVMSSVLGAAWPALSPWGGTVLINVLGSFIIGLFAAATAPGTAYAASTELRGFVMVGICGGFTTFSSFSLQTLDLLRAGRMPLALANIGLSVILCLIAVAIGFAVGQGLSSARG